MVEVIVGYLISMIIMGFISKYIAQTKGYEGGFAWGFFLGIIGLLVVGFRPTLLTNEEIIDARGNCEDLSLVNFNACVKSQTGSVVLYEEPEEKGYPFARIMNGEEVKVLKYSKNEGTKWAFVSHNGKQGYMAKENLQLDINEWNCICGSKNSSRLDSCPICRRTRKEAEMEKAICPHCGASNRKNNKNCFACGKLLQEEVKTKIVQKVESADREQGDLVDLLKKLAYLHEQGILTDEEYSQKKTDILNKI